MKISDTEALIALNLANVSFRRAEWLRKQYGALAAVFQAPESELREVFSRKPETAALILSLPDSDILKREMELLNSGGFWVLTPLDELYPERLRQIYDPPPVLYGKGDPGILKETAVAVVGCRRASIYGLRIARKLGAGLAASKVCVVSGLARGIDSAAHQGALDAGGPTVAVLGSGLLSIYPRENTGLAEKIVAAGALISEFPLTASPQKENFPRRNRIVSGLSLAVVVVEAAKRSGSLITADLALQQGRDVFAVPGPAGSVNAGGTNSLIKQGAALVETAPDVIEELGLCLVEEQPASPDFVSVLGLLRFLDDSPTHIDELIKKSGMTLSQVCCELLTLQMQGIISEMPGKRYIRR